MLLTQGQQTILTFPDSDKYAHAGRLTRVYRATVQKIAPTLHKLNKTGAAVAFTVNETTSRDRKTENITRVRAYFAELDGIPHPEEKRHKIEQLQAGPLAPSAIVETRNGLHAYWYSTGEEAIDPLDYKRVNNRIAHYHDGDTNALDISRVLRLPNFRHMKNPDDPYMVRLRHENPDAIYKREELLEAFPATADEHELTNRSAAAAAPTVIHDESLAGRYLQAALNNQEKNMRNTHPNSGNRNNTLNSAAYSLARYLHTGLITEEDIINTLGPAAQSTGLQDYEIKSTLRAAIAAGSRNPKALQPKGQHS